MRWVGVLLTIVVLSCSGLEALQVGQCGNGVWEPEAGEDCDTNAFDGQCGAAGGPGECRFVCRLALDCPAGRLCGLDGICRLPVREFGPAPRSPLTAIGDRFTIADVDGDLRDDLVGTNSRGAVVLFGAGDGQFVDRRTLITGTPTGRIVSARLGDDDSIELVTPIGRGVQVSTTLIDRVFRNVAHPAFDAAEIVGTNEARPIAMEIAGVSDAAIVLANDGDALIVRAASFIGFDPVSIAGGNLADLAGEPALGDIDGPAFSRTEELALGFVGGDRIGIYGLLCGASAELRDCASPIRYAFRTEVPVPGASGLGLGVALADADGDGFDDLYFHASGDTWVAINARDGTFEAAIRDQRFQRTCPDCAEWPLSIEDIDGDGRADFIGDAMVMTTTSSMTAEPRHLQQVSEHSRWSFVTTGDFDNDGRLDVALAQANQRGIEVVLGGPTPLWNAFFFDTTRTTLGIDAADFDGDGADDLAVIGDGTDHTVDVLYGSVTQILDRPIEMARFDRIARIVAGQIASLQEFGLDFRADLIVQSGVGETDVNISILFGTQENQMVAPAILGATPDAAKAPVALFGGNFFGDAVEPEGDVIVLTTAALWLIPSTPAGLLDIDSAKTVPTTLGASAGDVLFSVGNLDEDPRDEIVVATGGYPGVPRSGLDEPALYILDVTGADSIDIREIQLPSEVFAPANVEIVDRGIVDPPSIIMAFTGARAPSLAGASGGVVVMNTNGQGEVDGTPTLILAEPGIGVLSVAAANIDSDVRIELLVLSERHVFSIERRDDGYEWGPTVPLGADDRGPSIFGSMRARDLNRDGLADLIIANETGCYVYLAVDSAGNVDQ